MSDRTSLAPNCSMREVASGPRLCRSASHPSADHLTICDSPENSSNACCSATTPQSTTSRLQGSDHQSDASVAGRCSSSSNIYMQGRGIRPGFVPEIAIFFGHTGKSTALRSESKACEKRPCRRQLAPVVRAPLAVPWLTRIVALKSSTGAATVPTETPTYNCNRGPAGSAPGKQSPTVPIARR